LRVKKDAHWGLRRPRHSWRGLSRDRVSAFLLQCWALISQRDAGIKSALCVGKLTASQRDKKIRFEWNFLKIHTAIKNTRVAVTMAKPLGGSPFGGYIGKASAYSEIVEEAQV